MSNPYEPPGSPSWQRPEDAAKAQLQGPAIGLMIVSGISIGMLALALPLDVLLLVTNVLPNEPGEIDPKTQIVVRMIWSFAILIASAYSLYGGLCMKRGTSYGMARSGAVVACIPCLGPCCLLGIPFGAWALSVLNKPEVQQAFKD